MAGTVQFPVGVESLRGDSASPEAEREKETDSGVYPICLQSLSWVKPTWKLDGKGHRVFRRTRMRVLRGMDPGSEKTRWSTGTLDKHKQ